MSPDEITCCASGFAISGFGTPFLYSYIERQVLVHLKDLKTENLKEISRAFIFTKRGSKELYRQLMPRVQQILHIFTPRELCYMIYGYHKVGFMPKQFAKQIEAEVVKSLRDIEEVELELVQLIAQVYCRTRHGSREFHKLLETCILMRIPDLRANSKVLHSIGYELESS